jgi:hypothetical protein
MQAIVKKSSLRGKQAASRRFKFAVDIKTPFSRRNKRIVTLPLA